MAPKRDHCRPVGMAQAGSKLKEVGKAAEKSFKRKILDRFPAGEFVLLAKCAARDRHGAISERWYVFGSEVMKSAVTTSMPQIKEAHCQEGARAPDEALLRVPGTAKARARKARELLRQAWECHVQGTQWEGTKQMYKAVAAGGPLFDWWNAVAQVPFTATAVNDPDVAMRVCQHVGRQLFSCAQQRHQHLAS